MSNHELPGNDSSEGDSNDALSDFLAQFADLDAELDHLSSAHEPETAEEQFVIVRDQVFHNLEQRGIVRVIDPDASVESELFNKFAQTWQQRKMDQLQWTREGLSDISNGRLSLDCLTTYYDEREFEGMVIDCATVMICKQRYPDEWEDAPSTMDVTKKEMQALFMICYGRGADDDWYRFFDELAPGEGLDIARPEDQTHIDFGWRIFPEYEALNKKRKQVLEHACSIVGIDIDKDDPVAVLETASIIIEMRLMAETIVVDEQALAFRNALLLEHAQMLGVDPVVAMELVEFFDASYPLVELE